MTANQRLDPDGRPQPHDELPRGAPQTTLESAELRVECALLKERQGGLLENTFMRPTGALVRPQARTYTTLSTATRRPLFGSNPE